MECVQGCECSKVLLDAYWDESANIMYQGQVRVATASPQCRLRVTTREVRCSTWQSLPLETPAWALRLWCVLPLESPLRCGLSAWCALPVESPPYTPGWALSWCISPVESPPADVCLQSEVSGGSEFKVLAVIVGGRSSDQSIGIGEVLDLHWDLKPANFTGESVDNSGRPDFGRRRRGRRR